METCSGATGFSHSDIFLFDTKNNQSAIIENIEYRFLPFWIDVGKTYPPHYAFIESTFIGSNAEQIGASNKRINKIFSYDKNRNMYVENKKIEKKWFSKLYEKSKLTDKEIKILRRHKGDSDFTEEEKRIISKLLDNLRYAGKLGRLNEAKKILLEINNEISDRIWSLILYE